MTSSLASRPIPNAMLLVFAALASSCAAPGWIHQSTVRKKLGPDVVLLPIEPVAQESRNSCGLACLTAFLSYHGVPLDDEASERFGTSRVEESGVSAGELRNYLKSRGFRVALVRGSLDDEYPAGLFALLRREIPVIVQLAIPRRTGAATVHYVLVVGYEPRERWVLVMDPLRGIGAMSYSTFEECWEAANHLMLVAATVDASPTRVTYLP